MVIYKSFSFYVETFFYETILFLGFSFFFKFSKILRKNEYSKKTEAPILIEKILKKIEYLEFL